MLCKELLSSPSLHLAETGREKFPELQSYLSYMRQSFGTRVDDLPMEKVAGLEVVDGKLVIRAIDKSSINRALHELLPINEEVKEPDIVIPEEVLNVIKGAASQSAQARIRNLENIINSNMNNARARSRTLLNDFAAISKARLELYQLQNGTVDNPIVPGLRKILLAGFWKNLKFDQARKQVTFDSDDIWINFNDADARVNKRINIGAFTMVINVDGGLEIFFRSLRNNIVAHGHPHPHLSTEGTTHYLCLGNASASWETAANSLDVASMANIARIILTEYNPDNPYVSFDAFEREFIRRQHTALRVQNEQQIRDEYNQRVNAAAPGEVEWYDSAVPNF